ncbi:hypothetical protein [Cupriavidus oxalaticus]|uniref:Uncharacterized protein n=1 Tax=Cupriavidus oxalaticus TaxID=96344 RepID=A0A4P7LIT5_9BURK|nr:hypothetical protein [Cupriavidus oxalaticus]QBY55498.1 hypothetical protein E0W60_31225 [Cupriavidus oxalaticus]
MEFSYTRVYVLMAVVMVAGGAFLVALDLPWWGTAGGLVVLFGWCMNSAATGDAVARLLKK